MKKLGKIIRWIIGVCIILVGLALLSGIGVLTGVSMMLIGLLLLPPITSKIPQFKGRTPALIAGCIVLLFVAFAATPETDSASTPKPPQSSQAQDTPDAPSQDAQATEPTSTDTLDAETAEELRQWLKGAVATSTGTVNATKSELKKWGKIPEQELLPIWQSVVLEQVRIAEQSIGNAEAPSEETTFNNLVSYLNGVAGLYESLYSNSTEATGIKQLSSKLSQCVSANKELLKKYPFDLLTASPSYGTFYITQRLENSYSDNILGMLQKEFDSYQTKTTSDWVAYDVEYVLGTAMPGDTFRVLHADELNPFTQTGAYEVYYVDTGTTTETVDQKGFRNTVAVYQLVPNLDEADADRQEYMSNRDQCLTSIEALKYLLGAEEYINLQADKERIAEDISGTYYQDGDSTSGIHITMGADPADPASAGSFYRVVDGEGFGGAMLFEIAPNVYYSRTIEEETYVFGFSKQGQNIAMDTYYNGEHRGTATTTPTAAPETPAASPAPETPVNQTNTNSNPYADYNLHIYEGTYADSPESINLTLTVQPSESEFSCELFWIYGRMLEEGIVTPGVPAQLSEGTTITVDLETSGGIHVVLEGSGADPFNYEYDLFQ